MLNSANNWRRKQWHTAWICGSNIGLIVLDEFEGWERRASSKGKASEKDLIIKRKIHTCAAYQGICMHECHRKCISFLERGHGNHQEDNRETKWDSHP